MGYAMAEWRRLRGGNCAEGTCRGKEMQAQVEELGEWMRKVDEGWRCEMKWGEG